MEATIQVLREFGVMGLWGVVIYKVISIFEVIAVFTLIGYGIKKAWPQIKEFID